MDSRLQQAIVATRAGYTDLAQSLLSEAIKEDPQEVEAWFLLAHLVDSPGRQERYLQYVLHLEPEHSLARAHLERLRNPDIPAPVIKVASDQYLTAPQPTPPPTVDSVFSPIPPARTDPVLTAADATSSSPSFSSSAVDNQFPVVEQESSSIDTEWQRTAGKPERALPPKPPQRQTQPQTPKPTPVTTETIEEEKEAAPNKWLVAILIIMVAVAFFVLSFLAFTLFFQ